MKGYKYIMKKSCEGCKAFDFNSTNNLYLWKCCLNYKIDNIKGIPLENCPKPKTIKKMIDLKEIKEKYNLTNEELTNWKL